MRIAAIDIGTNSIHMIVVQVRPDRSFEVIDREKEMVRLGSGGLGGRALTESSMMTALQVLSKFRRLAESHEVDEIIAAATSAVREADNGREFLTAVRQRTSIRVRVISGTEEARLIHRAAVYGVDVAGGTAVVVDIGGGSVELTRGTAKQVQVARSAKIGVIRLTEQFVRSDPLTARDERRLTKFIESEIKETVEEIVGLGFDRVIGTSGTILSLGQLVASEEGAVAADDLRSRRIGVKQIRKLRRDLVGMTLADRLGLPGLDPRRADLAVAGSVLLDTILKRLRAKELTLCDLALREGLALDYIRKNRARIAKVEKYPDVRRRSVIELAERSNYFAQHADQVGRMAVTLFDQTTALHSLGAREREWLEYASLLHDIGVHISYGRHHKHSYYLVKNGDLRGFEPEEVEVIALVTRYHRRGLPKRSHDGFCDLSSELRRTVRTLSAILRVAEGLDRSHQQSVAALEIVPGGQDLLLRIKPAGDTELELWAAQRSVAPLERVLRRIIRFEVTPLHEKRPRSVVSARKKRTEASRSRDAETSNKPTQERTRRLRRTVASSR
jgi:exopolyphosphatase/guanosine-5'-triphosphate,3'-diphosphate pyrophosphatase